MKRIISIVFAVLSLAISGGIGPVEARQHIAEPDGGIAATENTSLCDDRPAVLTSALCRVEPLCICSLDIVQQAAPKRFSLLRPIPTDRSERFDARQLIAPGALIAVSTFGLWDKRAISVNESIRDKVGEWRNGRYFRADDYVQYLPLVSYAGLGLVGAKSRHTFTERVIVLGTSYIAMGIMVNAVKYTAREQRPDSSARNSYPSGHTATAFMGAELVRSEYGLGYGIAAYTVACGIAAMRIYNNRHWLNDVLAGAGIGILSARIGCWMLPLNRKLFGLNRSKRGISIAPSPLYDCQTRAVGGAVALRFQ